MEYTNIERIIAKIDNDFNPDNSDWIPRVAAWVIDAMQILKVTPKEEVKITAKVIERVAIFDCILSEDIKVYDENGCKIKEASSKKCCACDSSTGEETENYIYNGSNTIGINLTPDAKQKTISFTESRNAKDYPDRYNYHEIPIGGIKNKEYIRIDNNKIELNFDTDCITIIYKAPKTTISNFYNCKLPVVPNNGILIEAIVNYCMYKMLCRGYKHPVFNLNASQYGTNPYYLWISSIDKVKRSVMLDKQGNVIEDNGAWRNAFFDFTFNPKG